MQTSRKVPFIGPRSIMLDEMSRLVIDSFTVSSVDGFIH